LTLKCAFWFVVALCAVAYWFVARPIAGLVAYVMLGDCYAATNPVLCERQTVWIETVALAVAATIYSVLLWRAVRWFNRLGL
jgi:hypothetical protein